jgi:hypothetical protein
MSTKHDGAAPEHGRHQHAHTAPTTEQIRTIGQRRREAEEKLEHHLEEVRGKNAHRQIPIQEQEKERTGEGKVDGRDVAAIQNDHRLTPADRVDTISNQVLPEQGDY